MTNNPYPPIGIFCPVRGLCLSFFVSSFEISDIRSAKWIEMASKLEGIASDVASSGHGCNGNKVAQLMQAIIK
jgi:hypothetical protein